MTTPVRPTAPTRTKYPDADNFNIVRYQADALVYAADMQAQYQTLTNMVPSRQQNTYSSDLGWAASFLTVSARAYALYIGRALQASTIAAIRMQLVTSGAAGIAKVSEIGLFSSPVDPNASAQTLTKVKAQDLSTTDFTASAGTYAVTFSQALTAGVHYWLVVRFAYTGTPTQPTFTGRAGDNGTGRVLITSSASALTGITTLAGTVPTDAAAALCPDMVATTY